MNLSVRDRKDLPKTEGFEATLCMLIESIATRVHIS